MVEAEKAAIKSQLHARFADAAPEARLAAIQREIAALADDLAPLSQLRRFLYVVNALLHHQRFGGLRPTQVRQLGQLGFAILQTSGIVPGSSRLGGLHGDLHMVMSQIARKAGRHWQAAWHQVVGKNLAQRSSGRVETLGSANRALRLGHAQLALDRFAAAEHLGLSEAALAQARIGRIKALRLSGSPADALALADESQDLCPSRTSFTVELAWERLCAQVQLDGDLERMRLALRRSQPHHQSSYLLEGFLWLRSSARQTPWARFPTIRYLSRDQDLRLRRQGGFYRFALQIERCYQFETPVAVRQRHLGALLERAGSLVSIDKELLVWCASARWLARSKAFELASLALNEYRALSLRLSGGRSGDALGIAHDMLAREWAATARPDVDGGSKCA